jgi:beta-phosphoglucomutase-like phosphatase (HAD superfamily)
MSTERGRRAKERKRSRIVVNVDEPRRRGVRDPDRTSQHRRPRGMSRRGRRRITLVAAITGAIVVAALAGVYVWYQSYKKSPTYSLALLVDAAGRNDRQAIDQLLDADQVTRSLVPQVVAKVSAGAQGAQAGAAQVPASVRRYVEANAAVLIPGAREQVRDALVAGIKQGVASHTDSYPFFVTALGARFAADAINVQGDVANVSFKSNGQPVALGLQRSGAGERWRVISVQSDELATRIADNLSRGLPALGR